MREKEGKLVEGVGGRYEGWKKRSCWGSGEIKDEGKDGKQEREWVGGRMKKE